MIALGQDDTLKQRLQDATGSQQLPKRGKRPRHHRLRLGLQIRPLRRQKQRAAVREHEDQLQPTPAAHPAPQLKRAALPRVTPPDDLHPLRVAIEVGSVSCLPMSRFRTSG